MKIIAGLLFAWCALGQLYSQSKITGTIKGQIIDQATGEGLSFATVYLVGTDPAIGTVADAEGNYTLPDVPVGRYNIHYSFSGYEPYVAKELLLTSAKHLVLNISMQEAFNTLDEVIITAGVNKLKTVNELAGLSARMLSVEEANRYAGGFDDPARLASSFAGVSSGLQSNGIVVRGNNPGALLWRMEGVEIANPNHFADLASFGGGGLTALSSQMLANSDFLMGAFPSIYTNAISGVFDLSMRSGNNDQRENTVQVGLIGVDVSSEGPIGTKNGSYLFNYRYSTLGLLEPVLPENAGGTNYQDLAFKLKFPTKSYGTFSFWGLGLIDHSGQEIADQSEWEYESDQQQNDINQYMGSSGLKHILYVGNKTFLETDIGVTSNGLNLTVNQMETNGNIDLHEKIENNNWNLVTQAKLNTQFGKGNVFEFGVRNYLQNYDLLLQQNVEQSISTLVNDKGTSHLSSMYAMTQLQLRDGIKLQTGLNTVYFSLNDQFLLEPRASVEWQFQKTSLGLAYGLHSRTERLNYYLNRDGNGIQQNKNLKMTRSHHLIGTIALPLNENQRLKIEPYFQHLFDVPVLPNESFSFINLQNDWFINDRLSNNGKGRNYGIDLTLEKFLTNGYYYLVTGSLFKSEYVGGDNIWRSTAFDRGYVGNALFGKEWLVGRSKSNLAGLNLRLTYQGGQRFIPFNQELSLADMEVVDDDLNAYSAQLEDDLIVHFTATYRRNRPQHSSVWTLSILNATIVDEFQGFAYNRQTNTIDAITDGLIIPNLSYKIEF